MTIESALLDCKNVRETFRAWSVEQESLDAQLAESLSALAAYQSHLDTWQQQLVRQRDELHNAREQFDRDRAAAEQGQSQPSTELAAELHSSREKIAALTASLLSRTDELRTMDIRRGELANELELARAREKELAAAIAEHKQTSEQEQLKENPHPQPATPPDRPTSGRGHFSENPVLGSIVEQFGKLRQQRAIDRQALRKAR
jgi:septal ring factor EnvC (AmiA/AmiB activator)